MGDFLHLSSYKPLSFLVSSVSVFQNTVIPFNNNFLSLSAEQCNLHRYFSFVHYGGGEKNVKIVKQNMSEDWILN